MNVSQAVSSSVDEPGANLAKERAHIILYDAEGSDRFVEVDEIDVARLTEQQLLWIDIACDERGLLDDIGRWLRLPAEAMAALRRADVAPFLTNYGDCFHLQAVAVVHDGKLQFHGTALGIVAGANYVLSIHHHPIGFIDALRGRERGESELGALSAESFTASLLDWQLSTYFDAVSDFDAAAERLEVDILSDRDNRCFEELRNLRRGASRLRRMLAPHRALFAGLARPDFRPRSAGEANLHFQNLDSHYERAMDLVQNTRDMVVGSFELFSSQTALRTNETMRVLTFVTVVLGTLAVAAGLLGMNFEVPFFKTGAQGFWAAIASMGALVVVAVVLARHRRWI